MMTKGKLTERQKKFALEYIKSFDGRAAAICAGYAKNSAQATAKRLLKDNDVRKYLIESVRKQNDDKKKLGDEVMACWADVMRAEDDNVTTKERMKAAELLGKNLGLFEEENLGDKKKMVKIIDDIRKNACEAE